MKPRVLGVSAALLMCCASLLLPAAAWCADSVPGMEYVDKTCKPCQDFFRYANGAWMDTVKIPPAYVAVGAGREIYDRNQVALKRVLDNAAAKASIEEDPTLRKLGVLYGSMMDSTRLDRDGLKGIREALDKIDAMRSKADYTQTFAWVALRGQGLGQLAIPGFGIPFYFSPEIDPKNSSMMIGQIQQGGLGLPDRDFYFRKDAKSDTIRREFQAHTGRFLQLMGEDPATAKRHAADIMKLETALAESSMTLVAQRDPHAVYHKMTVAQLSKLCPGLDWPGYFKAVGVPSLADPNAKLDVSMPHFLVALNREINSVPLDTWKAYLKVRYATRDGAWIGKKYFDEIFHFNTLLTGTTTPLPQWKRAATKADDAMGDALGKAYVATEFPPSSKARVMDMVDNLLAALKDRIETRPWMSDSTKQQAIVKLSAIVKKIGYPDKWKDYSALDIDPKAPTIDNLTRCQKFAMEYKMNQINKPVDRSEWGMTPPTVNAYYDPLVNQIFFPAGILQPPQFDPNADDATNYGAIGMVIGHEITHGFDDQGRQYDAKGNLRNWWTEDDAAKFKAAAQKVVDQFNGYVAVDSLHVNGQLTLGENLADFGGLTIAYHAWQRSLHGKPAPVIDGYTGEQRFFLGYAHAWRSKIRPELLRTIVLTNPHSPAEWRVKGPLSNMPEFRAAFHCQAGDPMVTADSKRPEIW
ncbi:MAG TPA: M13 family metallopeptidase [Candidatus Sulfotelmatobacter sp.]|nr:M13 family metallopeptidase [Candidatus Sulfotelmatobacter sp.]